MLLAANWPAPPNIKAYASTRIGGVSEGDYAGLNLGEHVGDELQKVAENRQLLQSELINSGLYQNHKPYWLEQVHSNLCVAFASGLAKPQADASYTDKANQPLAIMTADCLPILFCDKQGHWIASAHAGWRGLLNGVIENTLACYSGNKNDLLAWVGPAISAKHFEVGVEVRAEFIQQASFWQAFFELNTNGRYQFDFVAGAKALLTGLGVDVYTSNLCSYEEASRFYSYRRDGETGRMASLIWRDE